MSIVIDDNCEIDSSARVGTKPFALKRKLVGKIKSRRTAKGGVHVQYGSKIGAGVTIQKGATRCTQIGYYSYLNDGSHVGHDTWIGQRTLVGLGSTISGYCDIGDDVNIGPGVTVSNRIKIGDGARIRIGSLVLSDVPAGADYAGRPAIPFEEFKRRRARLKELLGCADQ